MAVVQGRDSATIHRTPSSSAKRFGYLVGTVVNVLLLWVAHNLLDWEWPGFLTEEFDEVLPWITASCVVSIIGYGAMFVGVERLFPRLLNDAATTGVSFFGTWRTLQVFPFDFSTYDIDWSWPLRSLLILVLIGTLIGLTINIFKLITWPLSQPQLPPPQ